MDGGGTLHLPRALIAAAAAAAVAAMSEENKSHRYMKTMRWSLNSLSPQEYMHTQVPLGSTSSSSSSPFILI